MSEMRTNLSETGHLAGPKKGDPVNQYMEAVQAAASADKARRWTQPVKIFGYIVIVFAALIAGFGLLAGLAGLFTRTGSAALATIPASLVFAAVLFLQGSLVLMLAYYVQMRAEEVSMRVTKLLEDDGDDGVGPS